MAIVQSFDAFNLNTINFNKIFKAIKTTNLYDEENATINGTTYADIFQLLLKGKPPVSVEFMGSDITQNGPAITGGTVNAIYNFFYEKAEDTWYYSFALRDISVSAVDVSRAFQSKGTADDRALFASILAGDDLITLGQFNDNIDSGGGNDEVDGGAGKDSLSGGIGNDTLTGGDGADLITGGTGDDLILSEVDRDRDTFVFAGASGDDTITGFEDGIDRIRLADRSLSFGALTIVDEPDGGVVISFGDNTITLEDITANQLTARDFIFG